MHVNTKPKYLEKNKAFDETAVSLFILKETFLDQLTFLRISSKSVGFWGILFKLTKLLLRGLFDQEKL